MNEITKQILDEVQNSLKEDWDNLEQAHREDVERAAKRMGELTLAKLAGEDVDARLAIIKATIQNWKVVGEIAAADALEKAFWKGVEKAGSFLSSFLAAAIR